MEFSCFLHVASSIATGIVDALAPRYCALCGRAVAPASDEPASDEPARAGPGPLCPACVAALDAEAYPGPDRAAAGARRDRCDRCGKPLLAELRTCLRCRASEPGFDSAYPLFPYSGLARRVLLAYKTASRRSLAPFLADRLGNALRERYPGLPLVPVPPRPGKLRRKGWDQVELLARELERRHGVIAVRPLSRSGGAEQKALDLEGRRENLKGKFLLRDNAIVPAEVVLLDDVLTTGATLSECALALKGSGARRVYALVLAAD